ncbi:MAG: hypothetical protein Q4F21_14430 [Lachnospiraceae bacterium]|nr:hypothetical protein [Lachnospiraceae bacterium]
MYTEKEIRGLYRGNPFENIWTDIWNEYGWNGLLAGAEYIKTLYELVSGMQKAESNADIRKNLKDWYDFITDAAKSYKNYKTIGRAVGAQKAMTWWVKKITGLKPLERLSTAEKPVTRFVHNLTNKTSPFNAQFKSVIGDFKGTNGIGKAVVSWGAVVVDGIVNWFDNKDEQAKSGGKMTDQRVLNETIMETVVGTVLNYGAGIVVGAAVGAVLPVTTPGIVTLAVGGLVIASANAIVKNVTKGETITELISDSILNIYEYRANFVEKAVKTTNSWFVRMSLI